MKITLEATTVDSRIYDVTIDFTNYHRECKYFPYYGNILTWRSREVPISWLDDLLGAVKLRRISNWKMERAYKQPRHNLYRTTVISDRMNKRNDVG